MKSFYYLLISAYRCVYSRSLFSLVSFFQDSNEYGISDPLQSRKDIDKIEPFNLNMVPPTNETTTDCEERLPGSGELIIMVRTDPKLVPIHKVGVSVVGSVKKRSNFNGALSNNFLFPQWG